MKTLTGVVDCGLVPFPAWCEGHACPDMDDRQPAIEDANAALLAWYRHLVAERMALDEIVEQPVPSPHHPTQESCLLGIRWRENSG
jgi:hypothetical protein